MQKQKNNLLLLAFIEGASVMMCELMSAKLIAPFFGSSLYVWASVMGVTLFALMSGYYLGGFLSEKIKRQDLVYWILLLAGVFLAIMPNIALWVMSFMINVSVKWSSTISLLVFMFPPLVLMGTSSPIIINSINSSLDKTGKSAGRVYAISTFGGIVATYLVGFYLLPEFGIKWPTLVAGVILMTLPLIQLIQQKQYAALSLLLPIIYIAFSHAQKPIHTTENIQVLYESEGLLGQIKVIDMPYYSEKKGVTQGRALVVNNTVQSISEKNDLEYSLWDWSILFPAATSIYPKNSNLLLMGLGGGMLYHQFKRQGFNVDVVELDERIKDLAIKYFEVDSTINITIDDARHFINTSKKKYDVIVLDLFHNETPPEQVPTIEAFNKLKTMLSPKGMVLMNFYGYIEGEKGKAARSVIKTFETAGYIVTTFAQPGHEAYRNLMICATHTTPNWNSVYYTEKNLDTISSKNINNFIVNQSVIDLNDARILTDLEPKLSKMYVDLALERRRQQMTYFYSQIRRAGIDLIK